MQNMNSLLDNINKLQKQRQQQTQQRQNIPQMRLSEKVSIARRSPNSRLTTDYFNALGTEIRTPGNPNYNPYFSSTRGTMTDVLDFFGMDSLDDNWFQANSNLQNFAPRTAAGNLSTANQKNWTQDQWAGYYYVKALDARETTRQAQSEWADMLGKLQKNFQNYSAIYGRNMTLDEFLQSASTDGYSTLRAMDESRSFGVDGYSEMLELVSPVAYSQDALVGAYYALTRGETLDANRNYFEDAVGYYTDGANAQQQNAQEHKYSWQGTLGNYSQPYLEQMRNNIRLNGTTAELQAFDYEAYGTQPRMASLTGETSYFPETVYDDVFFEKYGSAMQPYLEQMKDRYGEIQSPKSDDDWTYHAAWEFYQLQQADEETRKIEAEFETLKERIMKAQFETPEQAAELVGLWLDEDGFEELKDYYEGDARTLREVYLSDESILGMAQAKLAGEDITQNAGDYALYSRRGEINSLNELYRAAQSSEAIERAARGDAAGVEQVLTGEAQANVDLSRIRSEAWQNSINTHVNLNREKYVALFGEDFTLYQAASVDNTLRAMVEETGIEYVESDLYLSGALSAYVDSAILNMQDTPYAEGGALSDYSLPYMSEVAQFVFENVDTIDAESLKYDASAYLNAAMYAQSAGMQPEQIAQFSVSYAAMQKMVGDALSGDPMKSKTLDATRTLVAALGDFSAFQKLADSFGGYVPLLQKTTALLNADDTAFDSPVSDQQLSEFVAGLLTSQAGISGDPAYDAMGSQILHDVQGGIITMEDVRSALLEDDEQTQLYKEYRVASGDLDAMKSEIEKLQAEHTALREEYEGIRVNFGPRDRKQEWQGFAQAQNADERRIEIEEELATLQSRYYSALTMQSDFSNIAESTRATMGEETLAAIDGYDQMTETERDVVAYLFGTQGEEAARQFGDYMQQTTLYRESAVRASELQNTNVFNRAMYVAGGQLVRMWNNLLDATTGTNTPIAQAEMLSSQLVENAEGFLDTAVMNVTSTVTNILPSTLISLVATPIGGAIVLGVNSYAEARRSAIQEGYTRQQASNYGVLVGLAEGAVSYALGGIGALGGKITGNALSKMVSKMSNGFLRFAVQWPGRMASEGLEEFIQNGVNTVFRNVALGEENSINPFTEEGWNSFLWGAATAGILELPGSISNARNPVQYETREVTTKHEADATTAEVISNVGADVRKTIESDGTPAQNLDATAPMPDYNAGNTLIDVTISDMRGYIGDIAQAYHYLDESRATDEAIASAADGIMNTLANMNAQDITLDGILARKAEIENTIASLNGILDNFPEDSYARANIQGAINHLTAWAERLVNVQSVRDSYLDGEIPTGQELRQALVDVFGEMPARQEGESQISSAAQNVRDFVARTQGVMTQARNRAAENIFSEARRAQYEENNRVAAQREYLRVEALQQQMENLQGEIQQLDANLRDLYATALQKGIPTDSGDTAQIIFNIKQEQSRAQGNYARLAQQLAAEQKRYEQFVQAQTVQTRQNLNNDRDQFRQSLQEQQAQTQAEAQNAAQDISRPALEQSDVQTQKNEARAKIEANQTVVDAWQALADATGNMRQDGMTAQALRSLLYKEAIAQLDGEMLSATRRKDRAALLELKKQRDAIYAMRDADAQIAEGGADATLEDMLDAAYRETGGSESYINFAYRMGGANLILEYFDKWHALQDSGKTATGIAQNFLAKAANFYKRRYSVLSQRYAQEYGIDALSLQRQLEIDATINPGPIAEGATAAQRSRRRGWLNETVYREPRPYDRADLLAQRAMEIDYSDEAGVASLMREITELNNSVTDDTLIRQLNQLQQTVAFTLASERISGMDTHAGLLEAGRLLNSTGDARYGELFWDLFDAAYVDANLQTKLDTLSELAHSEPTDSEFYRMLTQRMLEMTGLTSSEAALAVDETLAQEAQDDTPLVDIAAEEFARSAETITEADAPPQAESTTEAAKSESEAQQQSAQRPTQQQPAQEFTEEVRQVLDEAGDADTKAVIEAAQMSAEYEARISALNDQLKAVRKQRKSVYNERSDVIKRGKKMTEQAQMQENARQQDALTEQIHAFDEQASELEGEIARYKKLNAQEEKKLDAAIGKFLRGEEVHNIYKLIRAARDSQSPVDMYEVNKAFVTNSFEEVRAKLPQLKEAIRKYSRDGQLSTLTLEQAAEALKTVIDEDMLRKYKQVGKALHGVYKRSQQRVAVLKAELDQIRTDLHNATDEAEIDRLNAQYGKMRRTIDALETTAEITYNASTLYFQHGADSILEGLTGQNGSAYPQQVLDVVNAIIDEELATRKHGGARLKLIRMFSDPNRVIESAARDYAPLLKALYTGNIQQANGQIARRRAEINQRLRNAGLTRGNSEIVARYMDSGDASLLDEYSQADRDTIVRVATEARTVLDELWDENNAIRKKNGWGELKGRQNYYHHFVEGNNKILNELGLDFNDNNLPIAIVGQTYDTSPVRQYAGFEKARTGSDTVFDLEKSMDRYLPVILNNIYTTDTIVRLKQFGQGLEFLQKYHNMKKDAEITGFRTGPLETIKNWAGELQNTLAAKKSVLDRPMENVLGRKGYSVLNATQRLRSLAMTFGNVNVSVMNMLSLVKPIAFGGKYGVSAAAKMLLDPIVSAMRGDFAGYKARMIDFEKRSNFLTSRFNGDPLYTSTADKVVSAGYAMSRMSDRITANLVVRTFYEKALAQGYDRAAAMQQADSMAMRLMASNVRGEGGQFYGSKTGGMIFQFTREGVNDFISFFHDMPRMKKGDAIWAAGSTLVLNALWNVLTQDDTAIDPVGVLIRALEDTEDEEDLDKRLWTIAGALAENLIPVSSQFRGEIPFLSPIQDLIEGGSFTEAGWTLLSNFAPGAAAGKRLITGIQSMQQGYATTTSGNIRFPIEQNAINWVSVPLLGVWKTGEAREYSDERYLSESDSAWMREMMETGMDAFEAYDVLLQNRALNAVKKSDYDTQEAYEAAKAEARAATTTPKMPTWAMQMREDSAMQSAIAAWRESGLSVLPKEIDSFSRDKVEYKLTGEDKELFDEIYRQEYEAALRAYIPGVHSAEQLEKMVSDAERRAKDQYVILVKEE